MLNLLFLILVSADPQKPVLEFKGTPGVQFFGYCATGEKGKDQAISGVTPTKIYLDINIRKCSIERKSSDGTLKVRLFHKEKLITDQDVSGPGSGIELVIPFF